MYTKYYHWHNFQGQTLEEIKKMSFRKMFKSKGPKTGPSGTSLGTSPHSLFTLFTLFIYLSYLLYNVKACL